jgi:hypothetical protein
MRYLLLIRDDETDKLSPEEIRVHPPMASWLAEMDGRGVRRGGVRLRPSDDATTVRVREGELLLVDGPYAETKEQMGGFDVIECETLDEAIEIAAKHPTAAHGSVEVRPIWGEM